MRIVSFGRRTSRRLTDGPACDGGSQVIRMPGCDVEMSMKPGLAVASLILVCVSAGLLVAPLQRVVRFLNSLR